MMRAVHDSVVLYPSCANTAAALIGMMPDYPGISYMRTTREKTPILYKGDEKYEPAAANAAFVGQRQCTLIAAGITLHESLKAYDELKAAGIEVRVIDLYSVKLIDEKTLHKAAKETVF
ncbi:MAG: transketolase C-terminal domain-containing protein [Candidatus Obscuribacterales bacterium]